MLNEILSSHIFSIIIGAGMAILVIFDCLRIHAIQANLGYLKTSKFHSFTNQLEKTETYFSSNPNWLYKRTVIGLISSILIFIYFRDYAGRSSDINYDHLKVFFISIIYCKILFKAIMWQFFRVKPITFTKELDNTKSFNPLRSLIVISYIFGIISIILIGSAFSITSLLFAASLPALLYAIISSIRILYLKRA
ncbi:MAG: hypothetical protein GY777_09355 [Candidatus Brocadiaceae bacterium]|nr:hypothetical protein [Candidatus Brocadiaceae bacterium]